VGSVDADSIQRVVDGKPELWVVWIEDSAFDERHHADDGVEQGRAATRVGPWCAVDEVAVVILA